MTSNQDEHTAPQGMGREDRAYAQSWETVPGPCPLHFRMGADGEFQLWGRWVAGTDIGRALEQAGHALQNRADFLLEKARKAATVPAARPPARAGIASATPAVTPAGKKTSAA